MHIAEGILPSRIALFTSVLAAPFIAISALQLRRVLSSVEESSPQRPFLMMAFALCFAVTLLPIPVPIAGATSHMCATPLLALLFGWSVVPALSASILLLQALFFAHGGVTTLGANVLTLGVLGPTCVLTLVAMGRRLHMPLKMNLVISCTLASLAVYGGDALLLGWALGENQNFSKVFFAVTAGFLPVQGPLSLLEGVVSSAIVLRLMRENPDHLPGGLVRQFLVGRPSVGMSSFMGVTVAFLCVGFSGYARAQDFKGIDDTVFAKTAEAFGVIPGEIIPWMQGELELSIFSVGFFIAGCLVGSSFCRWQACKFVSARNKVGNPYAS